MSEEMKQIRKTLAEVGGHIQDLRAEQGQTVRELTSTQQTVQGMEQSVAGLQKSVDELQKSVGGLQQSVGGLQQSVGGLHQSVKNLQARAVTQEATTTALGGTFASLEQILLKVLADNERVTQLEQTVSNLLLRVEALERKAS